MFKELRRKIKLAKQLSKLAKELQKLKNEEQGTFDEIGHFLETAKVLYPKIGGILENIITITKNNIH